MERCSESLPQKIDHRGTALFHQDLLCSTPRLAAFCAGPIRTKIWDDLIRNAEPIADSGSLFAEHVQVAHALSVTETSKRSWFWEPEVIGKHVWKVSPLTGLHASAVGGNALVRRRKGLLDVMKGGVLQEHRHFCIASTISRVSMKILKILEFF